MAKFLLLLLFVLNVELCYGQKITKKELDNASLDNYVVENCKVKWVKIFDLKVNKDNIIKYLFSMINCSIKYSDDSTVLGVFEDISIDGTKYDYLDFLSGPLYGSFRIDLQDNSYRVTVSNIREYSSLSNTYLTLEWYALDKNCIFKSVYGFTKYSGKILEIMFSDWFNYKPQNNKW